VISARGRLRSRSGQSLPEYAVLLALTAIGLAILLLGFGKNVESIYAGANDALAWIASIATGAGGGASGAASGSVGSAGSGPAATVGSSPTNGAGSGSTTGGGSSGGAGGGGSQEEPKVTPPQ
jgi:Flp pilus assembly pilin Flp